LLAQSFHLLSELLHVLIETLQPLLIVSVQRSQQFHALRECLKSLVDVHAASAIMVEF
jgi:hypothetical protein